MKKGNGKLNRAQQQICDQFYTQYCDIQDFFAYHNLDLRGKALIFPCDTSASNFYGYFRDNFAFYRPQENNGHIL